MGVWFGFVVMCLIRLASSLGGGMWVFCLVLFISGKLFVDFFGGVLGFL